MATSSPSQQYGTAATTTTGRRVSTETKASFKTSELAVYILAVIGVLIASAVADSTDFGTQEAWWFITLLTIGYMISRGLAKSGSRDFYDDNHDDVNRGQRNHTTA
ncbi:hypothetical protein [Nocardioides antri]|uniref:Uncharacterized protein n=1 Tax=Nocardioides antri TaxID=2607659 RepID=A0A5B1M621_9ACTN|nr:hypothetical protein [Nocardioides antri]KAA1428241.1 hypothetical protein F0U47_04660 [Nocardioides antri]